jgi:hypothetical protein
MGLRPVAPRRALHCCFMTRARNRTVWSLVVLLCAPASFSAQQNVVASAPFRLPASETLNYTIEWRLITAGRAQLDWSAARVGNRPGWRTSLNLESTGLVSKLFKVSDTYSSQLRSDLCAVNSHINALEGRRHRETHIDFDAEAGKANYVERDMLKNAVVATHEVSIPECVHDMVGGLFKLRSMRLDPGQSAQVPMSDGKKSVMARVEAQQREEIVTPAGTFQTIRYEAFLFKDVLYRRDANLYVWLTDDARRLPVQIRVRMQFTVGTITLLLDKVDRT